MILTLSGSSGTGKTSIEKALIERLPNAKPLMSTTTRAPRVSDLPGDFEYVTVNEWNAMNERGEFLWTAAVGETRHATKTAYLEHALNDQGTLWLMILVPERVPNLHAFAAKMGCEDDVCSFYILNPADDILHRRMATRGDAPESIEERMRACKEFQERAEASDIPFIWIEDRDDLEEKIKTVLALMQGSSFIPPRGGSPGSPASFRAAR